MNVKALNVQDDCRETEINQLLGRRCGTATSKMKTQYLANLC